MRWTPTEAEQKALLADVAKRAGDDKPLADSLLFSALYGAKDGLYPRRGAKADWRFEGGKWERYRRNLSAREWIEQFFPIRTKAGKITRLVLNQAQRDFYADVLRMERAGVPVRIQILKARQLGFSTFIQAFLFEKELREKDVRGLIVAHNEKTSSMLLAIADVGLTRMEKTSGANGRTVPWSFKMRGRAKSGIEFDEPIFGLIEITSAKTVGAGVGGTRTLIHLSEGSRYENAAGVHSSVMPSLPSLPGTYGFDESTAYGDTGKFRDDFWDAWENRDVPFIDRSGAWHAVFFAWWAHPEYTWTKSYGSGRTLPVPMLAEIESTLTDEEKWLLEQKFLRRWTPEDEWVQRRCWEYKPLIIENGKIVGEGKRLKPSVDLKWERRGVGWQKVSVDQLAWRRTKIKDKEIGGDIRLFDQDFPSRPEVAFMASGSPVFDVHALDEYLRAAKETQPLFRGFLLPTPAPDGTPIHDKAKLEPNPRGGLSIWAHPIPGRQYVLASDTAGGGATGDFAVAIVLDAETCDIVAGWRERADPHVWGPKCARLAWYYNTAMLAFETQPSTHGLTAATEAKNIGYQRNYHRRRRDSIKKTQTDVLGFHTNSESKPLMIDRIKKALEAKLSIPWEELLRELKDQAWDDTGKMTSRKHDDMVDAYGIALMVRDDCYFRQLITAEVKVPQTESERYWAREDQRVAHQEALARRHRSGMRRQPRWL